ISCLASTTSLNAATAPDPPSVVIKAKVKGVWGADPQPDEDTQKNELMARFSFADQLTTKQLSLINSGFSTYSILVVKDADPDDFVRGKELYRITCTTKFDPWEERYETARLDHHPMTFTFK